MQVVDASTTSGWARTSRLKMLLAVVPVSANMDCSCGRY